MTLKISAALGVFSGSPDRYCPQGYREPLRLQERVATVSKIKGIKAVEIAQTDVTPEVPVKELKRMLKDYSLACSGVSANLAHDRRFALGAFGHQHPKTRNAAIDEGRKAVDIARALGASEITLRLYTDGFDYPFQIDYAAHWNTLISSIKTIAKYASPDVNVAIAYKCREPRKCLTVATVGKALSLCQEIAMKNVGVAMNFAHAMMAGENPAESIAFLARSNKLFQMYITESYRLWDDMLIPGTVHTWELMEALLYLKLTKYKGFLTLDMLPQRIDPSQACQIATGNLAIFWKKLDKLDTSDLRKAQKTLDAVESQKLVRRVMLQG
ncbi:MAG: sugar phosphate isomerase/epimerase [bacterium]|nr:sugar phosphate isomerase/epimerase [bacterium]